jgi:subtilisin family serine protease
MSGDPNQQLDVVNLSLGSSYGFPHILYNEAIGNLSKGGTVVVASAGNSGPNDHIVGAPSVADEAISVAASVDHSEHNWKFAAVKFQTPSQGEILTEAVEAPIARPISEADIAGALVFVGLADADLSHELVAQVSGKVAFIDRGKVAFSDKIKRAQKAGAIGVVVGNNQPGEPFKMGGNGNYQIPAIMISQALADNLKQEMKKGEVTIRFKNAEMIEKPELIDTITSFSSKDFLTWR